MFPEKAAEMAAFFIQRLRALAALA